LKLRVVRTEETHIQVGAGEAKGFFEAVRWLVVCARTQYSETSSPQETALILVQSDQVSQTIQQSFRLCTHAVPIQRSGDDPSVMVEQALNQGKKVIVLVGVLVRVVADLQLAEILKGMRASWEREVDQCSRVPC